MKIYVIGNLSVEQDRLPLTMLPVLTETFPRVSLEEVDPNENFIPEDGSIIIDTVEKITNVQWFNDINAFVATRSISPHDYDLGFHLLLLHKLHKLSSIRILGVPQKGDREEIISSVISELRSVISPDQ